MTGDKGVAGDKGAAGAPGTGGTGETGATGPAGLKGDQGDQGDQGDTGTPGAKGSQGSQGNQGIQGPTGPSGGLTGDKGDQGNTGPTGATGNPGSAGSKGQPGDQGPAGITGPSGGGGTGCCCCCYMEDFDTFLTGETFFSEYWGLKCLVGIGATGDTGATGTVYPTIYNSTSGLFTAYNTPNTDFAGSGVGSGGSAISLGMNRLVQNQVLLVNSTPPTMPSKIVSPVIPVVTPNTLTFYFTAGVVGSLQAVDVINVPTGTDPTANQQFVVITTYDSNGNVVATQSQDGWGINSFQHIPFYDQSETVKSFSVRFRTTGAIAKIYYTCCDCCHLVQVARAKTSGTFPQTQGAVTWQSNTQAFVPASGDALVNYGWSTGTTGSLAVNFTNFVTSGSGTVQVTGNINTGVDCVFIMGSANQAGTNVTGVISPNGKTILLGNGSTPTISYVELLLKCCADTINLD